MPTIPIRQQILKEKPCRVCEKLFQPNTSVHYYCSPQCKGRMQYVNGYGSVENQYKRINYNWRKYLQRLLYFGDRGDRSKIKIEDLLSLIEKQNYKCALSGVPLTCILEKGTINFTNASVDRVKPGGEYTPDNIRLVCRIANTMKWNMSDEELYSWCRKILSHGERQKKGLQKRSEVGVFARAEAPQGREKQS